MSILHHKLNIKINTLLQKILYFEIVTAVPIRKHNLSPKMQNSLIKTDLTLIYIYNKDNFLKVLYIRYVVYNVFYCRGRQVKLNLSA